MMRILIFIGLKVVELLGAVAVYIVLWMAGWGMAIRLGLLLDWVWYETWIFLPIIGFVIISVSGMIASAAYMVIESNWRKAGEIARRLKR